MHSKQIEKLLEAIPQQQIERARPGLADEVKSAIPHRLSRHRIDTVNIIVDLRVSRMAAAAAILVAMLLIGGFLGAHNVLGRRAYQDSKLLLKYTLGGEKAYRAESLVGLAKFRDDLVARGREVVYYGDRADLSDPYTILMHWAVSDDAYVVVFGDLSTRTIPARSLIRLQARMLQERAK
jgi:hypothetical protein